MRSLSFAALAIGLFFSIPVSAQKTVYSRGILSGHPSPEMIRKDFMTGMPGFRSCHQANIEKGGKEVSKVMVYFSIGGNGYAFSPKIEGDVPKEVSDCLIAVLVSIQFQPYESERGLDVKQPVDFKAISLTGSKEKK